MDGKKAEQMLAALGEVLEKQNAKIVDIVVCGGMALVLQGMTDRRTRDIDGLGLVVDNGGTLKLKKPLVGKQFSDAVERVGAVYGEGKNWFGFAAIVLHDDTTLPAGLVKRAMVKQYGSRLRLCSRQDMVCLKMWAALNRSGPDMGDLMDMGTSEEEAEAGFKWCL